MTDPTEPLEHDRAMTTLLDAQKQVPSLAHGKVDAGVMSVLEKLEPLVGSLVALDLTDDTL
ncbi:MAG: hypothetical protein ACYTEQ_25990 [Planctomycetota bacterium]|jgi:hypothetical protein